LSSILFRQVPVKQYAWPLACIPIGHGPHKDCLIFKDNNAKLMLRRNMPSIDTTNAGF